MGVCRNIHNTKPKRTPEVQSERPKSQELPQSALLCLSIGMVSVCAALLSLPKAPNPPLVGCRMDRVHLLSTHQIFFCFPWSHVCPFVTPILLWRRE